MSTVEAIITFTCIEDEDDWKTSAKIVFLAQAHKWLGN